MGVKSDTAGSNTSVIPMACKPWIRSSWPDMSNLGMDRLTIRYFWFSHSPSESRNSMASGSASSWSTLTPSSGKTIHRVPPYSTDFPTAEN